MDLVPLLGIVGVGVASGTISGLLGVGGATVSTPGVRLFGATPLQAVGSTIPAVLPSAITGAWRSARAGLVDWRVALVCGGVGSVAAVGGALVSDHIDPHLLMLLTATVLLWSGATVLRSSPGSVDPDVTALLVAAEGTPRSDGRLAVIAPTPVGADATVAAGSGAIAVAGVAAGTLAGLLGIGGGVVLMPLFTGILRLPVKRAVPTSLVAVAVFSVPALAAHALLGHIQWAIALALVVGSVPGARLGARLNRQASDAAVQRLFGLFLVVLAIGYGLTELDGLLAFAR